MNHTSISPSKIQSTECWHYFYMNYLSEDRHNRNTEGSDTPVNLLIGRLVHAVMDSYTKILMQHKLSSDATLFEDIFDAMWAAVPFLPNSLHDETKEDMLRFAEKFSLDLSTIWASEKKIALTWECEETEWEAKDAWLRVVLDKVDVYPGDATVLITDYKSQRYIPSEKALRRSLQSKLYTFALHKINPYFQRFILRYWYLRWGTWVDVVFDGLDLDDQFDKIEKELRAFTERLDGKIADPNSAFPALRCENCGICRYDCPLAEMGIEPARTHDKAIEIAMQIEATETKVKKLKDELKNYVKATDDTVEIHSGKWMFKPNQILKGITPSHIVQYGHEKGIKVDDLPLKFDSDAFRKNAGPEMKEAITALGKISTQSRFSFVKTAKTGEGEEE